MSALVAPPPDASPPGNDVVPPVVTQPPDPTPAPSRWQRIKPRLVATFVSFHLLSVIIYVLPYPPYFDEKSMNLPEVKEELGMFFGALHKVVPIFRTREELQTETLIFVRAWMKVYFSMRKVFEPYVEATGSTQSWNMFGGTPPRMPKVMVIEVKPVGENEFVQWLDLRWGTPESSEMDFRHRKTHEILGLVGWDRQREQYAEWWGREWNKLHPDRPAGTVRLSYIQFRTPPIHEVVDGKMDRRPKNGVATFVREMPK